MLRHIGILILMAVGSLQTAAPVAAQAASAADVAETARQNRAHELSTILARMESPDRQSRETAFNDLLNFLPANDSPNGNAGAQPQAYFLSRNTDEAKLVRGALIHLLSTETIRSSPSLRVSRSQQLRLRSRTLRPKALRTNIIPSS